MYIGDLHIHSRYSRATSRDCTPEYLELWARKKGINIVGTGDFTHPAWRQELREKLEPAEDGLYVLKEEYRIREGAPDERKPRFVVTGEISSIYKKYDRVRKVHSLLLLPGLEEADRLSRHLELIGNIYSDGRPILGLDCRDLLEIMLETCEDAVYVPAHIWTPHFSLFGAFSGFDRIEDCYGDLTPYIHALETGLSSDPPMNWRISALDSFWLISNSDAHSPAKLGREASLFDIELSYAGLVRAVCQGDGLVGTLEFFPEEGKYHFDGHRKCGLCISPDEAVKYGNVCPVCGKKMTTGVLHRVEELADRGEGHRAAHARMFESLVPLPEVIAASTGRSVGSKKVQEEYERMLYSLGSEFTILLRTPVEDIKRAAGPLIAEGIGRLREGRVERTPGYDGEYGTIRLLAPAEISLLQGQLCLFTKEELEAQEKKTEPAAVTACAPAGQLEKNGKEDGRTAEKTRETVDLPNIRQQEAAFAQERTIAVIAGPGAGKTKTLLSHLIFILEQRKIKPGTIAVVTFTNRAADELKSRLEKLPGGRRRMKKLQIGTFHSICGRLLTESGLSFTVADEGLQMELAEKTIESLGLKMQARRFLREVSLQKSGGEETLSPEALALYQTLLEQEGALDYDDLLLSALRLAEGENAPEEDMEGGRQNTGFACILVDEFQDINPIQYRLIQAWNRGGSELFVIGDPDQSIYGFRGSDARCFERLEEDCPQLRKIALTENYRSTPEIITAALSVIAGNGGKERHMDAVRGNGCPVRIVSAEDERNEAIFIAKEINRLIGGIDMLDVEENEIRGERKERGFSDIAVLYRTHRQARLLEYCLRQEGIPYIVAGREDFLSDSSVRSALYFFRYLLYPEAAGNRPLMEKLFYRSCGGRPEEGEAQLNLLLDKYGKNIQKARPVKLLESWAKDRKLAEEEAVKKLLDMSVLYSTMEAFLHTLRFGEDGDIRRNGGRKFLSDTVTLMTFHGAKGLEFPVVFLYGIRKGLAPLETAAGADDVEEERRLFYVGMTRAEDELIITTSGEESPFLKESSGMTVCREYAKKVNQELEATQLNLFD